jgi:hypothetical protein
MKLKGPRTLKSFLFPSHYHPPLVSCPSFPPHQLQLSLPTVMSKRRIAPNTMPCIAHAGARGWSGVNELLLFLSPRGRAHGSLTKVIFGIRRGLIYQVFPTPPPCMKIRHIDDCSVARESDVQYKASGLREREGAKKQVSSRCWQGKSPRRLRLGTALMTSLPHDVSRMATPGVKKKKENEKKGPPLIWFPFL